MSSGVTPTPGWTPPKTPEAAKGEGYREVSRSTTVPTSRPNAGYSVETYVMEKSPVDKYYTATAVYQRVSGEKGKENYGAWNPAYSAKELTTVPANPNDARNDPGVKDFYEKFVETWAENNLINWTKKSHERTKKAFKPHQ
jgi:hypothetical protein